DLQKPSPLKPPGSLLPRPPKGFTETNPPLQPVRANDVAGYEFAECDKVRSARAGHKDCDNTLAGVFRIYGER
ncbi:hypothetical protein ABTF44_21960, partial [Acinetobacter baumannii]